MDILLGILAALFAGLDIFQFFFFRSTKKQYEAKAEKAEMETAAAANEYLENRIISMEKLYKEQGEVLDSVRRDVLRLGKEVQERDEKIIRYESEIKSLTDKVERLEKELEECKTITKKGNG